MENLSNISLLIVALNSTVLLGSSVTIVIVSLIGDHRYMIVTIILGMIFVSSQIAELASAASVVATPSLAASMMVIQVHGSHIALGMSILVCTTITGLTDGDSDEIRDIGAAYWHLIDVVWIVILLFVFGF
jgi:heme/copper-type cytochrome/quinol oxidase subunit 3